MSIIEVLAYAAGCDADTCQRRASDDGDFAFWGDPGSAIDEAVQGGWYVRKGPGDGPEFLCDRHAPKCRCDGCPECNDGGCPVTLRDDEFGDRCEDCFVDPLRPSVDAPVPGVTE